MAAFWNRLALIVMVLGIGVPAGAQARSKSRPQSANLPRISLAQIAQGKALGSPTAPVKIEDFTDFECPACRGLYMQTLRPLINQYVSAGKVYLVHHDFPLSMHKYSHVTAYYANAAAAIGRFPQVENVLFSYQPKWSANGKVVPFLAAVLTPTELKQVEELAKTREVQQAVQNDFELGEKLGVNQTPTMYITHKGKRVRVVGVYSFAILRRYIDALLAQ